MKGTMFRIFTEDLNQYGICSIISNYFPSFTLLSGIGIWNNQKEKSLIIEILTEEKEIRMIEKIANEIKALNKQEAVLIQKIENNSFLV